MAQDDTKVVVSLGGGGVRMVAHVSVLRFLEEIGVEDYVSEVWGASGGAIVGFIYSMGKNSQQIEEEIKRFLKSEKKFKIAPSIFSVAKNIVADTFFASSSAQSIKGFHDIQSALQEWIGEILKGSQERYPFYCLAYNIAKNQTEVLTPMRVPKGLYPDWIHQSDPLDAIVASSAIPILFVPKVIEDDGGRRIYVDGASNEEVPTVSIYKKWLLDRELGLEKRKRLLVVAVNLNPEFASLGFLENWLIRKIPAFQYIEMTIHYADLMRKARIEEQKRTLMSDPNVELWELSLKLKGGGLMNIDLIPKIIEVAEKSFPQQFARINDSLLG
jgi:predicted acylesterase/phospholipase RssA